MMSQEELDGQPSLDQMLDLEDPEVLKGLGALAKRARERQSQSRQDLQMQQKKTLEE